MDEYTAKQLRRIEKKVDALLGIAGALIMVGTVHWWAPELVKRYGISEGWSIAIAAVVGTLLFNFLRREVED